MKRILLAASAIVAFAGTASAADMRAPVYKAIAPVSAYNWTGLYLGVNAGIGVGRNPSSLVAPTAPSFESFTQAPIGAIGGVQAGYNWQFGNWVIGAEADLQVSGQKDSDTCLLLCRTIASATFDQSLDWFGTARARIGYANGPILGYYTGGFAYGHAKTSINESIGGATGAFSLSDTRTGWTLGSGVEAALDGNWTGKVEYLYVDLGTMSGVYTLGGVAHSFSTDIRSHVVRAGLNYRFGGPGSLAPQSIGNWVGFYAGGNAGAGHSRNESNLFLASAPPSPERFVLTPEGFLGGVQAGYNWQAARWVFGLEADIQGSVLKDDDACVLTCSATAAATIEQKMPWFGTVRGRVGYATGPALFYVTGGLAYGAVKTTITERINGVNGGASFSDTNAGWTIGGGIERPFDLFGLLPPGNWTSKTEYLYVDLGSSSHTYTTAGFAQTFRTDATSHIFRTGINYQFNAGPVVAKY